LRHFARRTSHEITGMLSYQAMRAPQRGQFDGGETMLPPLGTRAITTLRKLPRQAPTTNTDTSIKRANAAALMRWERAPPAAPARRTGSPASGDAAPPRRARRRTRRWRAAPRAPPARQERPAPTPRAAA